MKLETKESSTDYRTHSTGRRPRFYPWKCSPLSDSPRSELEVAAPLNVTQYPYNQNKPIQQEKKNTTVHVSDRLDFVISNKLRTKL